MNNFYLTTIRHAVLSFVHKLAKPAYDFRPFHTTDVLDINTFTGTKVLSVHLSSEKIAEYVIKIKRLEEDAVFFKTAESVHDLSRMLNIPCRQLTSLLNHHYNLRYNDFINGYRIRYILSQFKEGKLKEFTMEAIAFEAGFTSRTTFFTAFKKYTGKNPTQFIQNQ